MKNRRNIEKAKNKIHSLHTIHCPLKSAKKRRELRGKTFLCEAVNKTVIATLCGKRCNNEKCLKKRKTKNKN